jgi:hypothetical protein
MHALFTAKAMYEARGLNFEQDLGYYLTNGIVISQPDRFIMAKPIRKEVGEKDWHPEHADSWYVHFAVGKDCLRWFLKQAPYRLPFLAWSRNKGDEAKLRIYPTARFERIAK